MKDERIIHILEGLKKSFCARLIRYDIDGEPIDPKGLEAVNATIKNHEWHINKAINQLTK